MSLRKSKSWYSNNCLHFKVCCSIGFCQKWTLINLNQNLFVLINYYQFEQNLIKSKMGARKQTGENLKVVGRVFNFKLDSFAVMKYVHGTHTWLYLKLKTWFGRVSLILSMEREETLQESVRLQLAAGNPYWTGRLSTLNLLNKKCCFVKKLKNNVCTKSSWSELVSTRRSTVLILPLQ